MIAEIKMIITEISNETELAWAYYCVIAAAPYANEWSSWAGDVMNEISEKVLERTGNNVRTHDVARLFRLTKGDRLLARLRFNSEEVNDRGEKLGREVNVGDEIFFDIEGWLSNEMAHGIVTEIRLLVINGLMEEYYDRRSECRDAKRKRGSQLVALIDQWKTAGLTKAQIGDRLVTTLEGDVAEKIRYLGDAWSTIERGVLLRELRVAWDEGLLGPSELWKLINVLDRWSDGRNKRFDNLMKVRERITSQIVSARLELVGRDDDRDRSGWLDSDGSTRHVSRNEYCPCGSGKKFKHCHGVQTGL